MNVRVLPVIALTALFMVAWSGDRNAMQAAVAKRDAVQSVLLAEAYGRKSLSLEEASHVAAVASQSTATSAVSLTASQDEVPLPNGIVAGDYQAVNQTGKSVRIRVADADASIRSERDFYISDSANGDRWYLVRIQGTSVN